MAPTDLSVQEQQAAGKKQRVANDFSIQVATVNGSGSQTANLVLLRSIFRMGVPVSGKNMFPSNIAGLPTWYTIRANPQGYVGRKKEVDFLVAMNPETAREDVLTLAPGAAVLYDEPLKLSGLRDDVVFYPVPFDKIVAEFCKDAKLRRLVKNMIYDGVLSKLLDIDLAQMEDALRKQMGRKLKAIELNLAALEAGSRYTGDNLVKKDPFSIEPMEETRGMILVEGNAAAAFGCMMAGVTVCAWYPITPSSSLPETLIQLMKKYRHDADGKATYAIIQAEDEIASIGMVIGAGWAGARAMTSTSGPGISLMGEFAGLAYYAEVPGVVFDIQRVGPSTGLPTRTAQGDIVSTALLSHGNTKQILLIPSSVEECYTMSLQAFDLAERFQTLIFVMSDLDLAMNSWMATPFTYPETPLDRGKILDDAALQRIGEWGRYRDVDGDGIPFRTIPGTGAPAYFTRGSGHNERGQYSERPDDYVHNMERLARKFDTARDYVPKPILTGALDSDIAIVGYGSSHWAIEESRDQLAREAGATTAYMRLRAYPFTEELEAFIDHHQRIYVVEQNRDAQMLSLMRLALSAERGAKLRKVLHYNGLPIDARSITDEILAQEGINQKPSVTPALVGDTE